jgi:hypothetical protein
MIQGAGLGSSGILMSGSGTVQTATGDIELTGSSADVNAATQGIFMTTGIITSNGANIRLTGTGAPNGQPANDGVYVHDSSQINTTGTGTIDITGTGGGNSVNTDGVDIGNLSVVTNVDGSLTLTGTTAPSNGIFGVVVVSSTVESTGNGKLALNATDAFGGTDMTLDAGPAGDLSITAKIIAWSGTTTVAGVGNLTIQPGTAGTTIGLGGGAGTLNLDDTELGFLQDGFSAITIGRNDAGAVTVNSATFNDPLTLLTGGALASDVARTSPRRPSIWAVPFRPVCSRSQARW